MRPFLQIFYLLVFLFGFNIQAQAQTLRFSTIHYPPLINDSQTGLVIDLTKEMTKRLGYKVEFTLYPWARALSTAVKGRTDGILPAFKTKKREETLIFNQVPLLSMEMMLFKTVRGKDNFDGSVKSIRGKKIVFITGTNLNKDFDDAKTDGRIIPIYANSLEQQLKMLNPGRADFIVAERFSGIHKAAELGLTWNLQPSKIPITSNPGFIGFNKTSKHQIFASEIDKVITEMKNDGSYEALIKAYTSPVSSQ